MRSLVQRRFNTIDAMVLVAAIAVGFAGGRAYLSQRLADLRMAGVDSEVQFSDIARAGKWAYGIVGSAKPLLLALTLAFPLLRLRLPRPKLRQIMRQPGMAACTTVLVVMLIGLVKALSFHATLLMVLGEDSHLISMQDWTWEFDKSTDRGGEAVAAVWLTLALGRAYRFERGWIDRLAIILGCGWILYLFSGSISQCVAKLLFYNNYFN